MPRITLSHLYRMKQNAEKITCLTAYDATLAHVLSASGIEILLVGDTLGMTMGGHATTVPVTVDDMVYHTHNVCRADPESLVLVDMPFLSYTDPETALKTAGRLMQAGAQIVKLEGGAWLAANVQRLSEQGIPACVHLGLTPQSVHIFGGYKIQGRDPLQAKDIFDAAVTLQNAGAKLLVLECVPHVLAEKIRDTLAIPVMGIGAGPNCDGQILVTHDMLGLTPGKPLTFVKNFLMGQTEGVQGAIKAFIHQVKSGVFPNLEQSFT